MEIYTNKPLAEVKADVANDELWNLISHALRAMMAAKDFDKLQRTLGADAEMVNDDDFTVSIRLNFQHIAACIKAIKVEDGDAYLVEVLTYA